MCKRRNKGAMERYNDLAVTFQTVQTSSRYLIKNIANLQTVRRLKV